MALIKCPECGKEVSNTISQCIHCGYHLHGAITEKVIEEKKTGIETICHRGEPGTGSRVFNSLGLVGGFVSLFFAILLFIFVATGYVYFVVIAIIFSVIAIPLLFKAISGLVLRSKNSKNKFPCIVYDYDSDRVVVCTIDGKKEVIDIQKYHSISRSFWASSDLMMFLYTDESGQMKWLNLGYPLTNAKSVKNTLDELKKNKMSRK